MSLVLLTGLPSTGKTTNCEALIESGYPAFDVDNNGLAYAIEGGYRLDIYKINIIKHTFADELAFVCGSVKDDLEYWDAFDGHVALMASKEWMTEGLIYRRNNSWGKRREEREAMFKKREAKNQLYADAGALIIHADQQPFTNTLLDVITYGLSLPKN